MHRAFVAANSLILERRIAGEVSDDEWRDRNLIRLSARIGGGSRAPPMPAMGPGSLLPDRRDD